MTYFYDQAFFSKLVSCAVLLFFLALGLQLFDLGLVDAKLVFWVLSVIVAAIFGKTVVLLFIASPLYRKERWILGLALLLRGELGLIVASIGLSKQNISHHGMVALKIMTLMMALLLPLLLPRFRDWPVSRTEV